MSATVPGDGPQGPSRGYDIRMVRLWLLILATAAFGQKGRALSDPAAVESGRQTYLGACSGCHGATGEGSQGPSLLSGRASRLDDRALFSTIRFGVPGTSMPEFPLADEKVRQVVAFVRSLTAPAAAAVLPGDSARGRSLFFGEGKCSGCHMIRGVGGHPGPDLSNIGVERTVHQLRESMLKPSARIEDGYWTASAVLRDGRRIGGVAKNYNNYSVQIVDGRGHLHLLERAELKEFTVSDTSLMPPVANGATAADLLAFLAQQATRPYEGASR